MATEGHSFMFGGTKKRSTLVEEKIIYFPREDSEAPRQKILIEFCHTQHDKFMECLAANGFDENKCPSEKKLLTQCANKAFKQVNSDSKFIF